MARSNTEIRHGLPWMRSPDMPVWWSGFRSTTYELQQNGWEFVVEQDHYRGAFRFFLRERHSGQVGYGAIEERHVQEHADVSRQFFNQGVRDGAPLEVQTMRSEDRVVIRSAGPLRAVRIDMEPMVEFRERPLSNYDLFRPWAPAAKDIILPQDSAMDLLERLKKLHAPEMEKARERAKMETRRAGETIHAQIISIAD